MTKEELQTQTNEILRELRGLQNQLDILQDDTDIEADNRNKSIIKVFKMNKLTITRYIFKPYFDGYFQDGNFYSKDAKRYTISMFKDFKRLINITHT